MKKFLSRAADGLNPGYFSFVMATGIISIAAFEQQLMKTAYVLFTINKIAYAVLIILMAIRSVFLPSELLVDMTAPSRAPKLFTITAGTCVLGSQYIILSKAFGAGIAFWCAGLFFWSVLIYVFFAAASVNESKSSLEDGLDGMWLIYVVGTQAVAVISTLLAPHVTDWIFFLLFAAGMHSAGNALYFIMIVLVTRRMVFLGLPPAKLTPPYWINMGAAAISTLAGAELILHSDQWGFLREVLPALKWFTVMFWVLATWWIPLLVILNIWRYGYKHFPITYDVQHWSMVFPLGMYTVCSFQFGKAAALAPLLVISWYFLYLALAAWIAVFLGMVADSLRKFQKGGNCRQNRNS